MSHVYVTILTSESLTWQPGIKAKEPCFECSLVLINSVIIMHMFCLCAFEALPYLCMQMAFCFNKVPDVFRKATIYFIHATQYSVPILKIW